MKTKPARGETPTLNVRAIPILTSADQAAITSAMATLTALSDAVGGAMRSMAPHNFFALPCEDQDLSFRHGQTVGVAQVFASRCAHVGIDLKFTYDVASKTTTYDALPKYHPAFHWGLFTPLSAAINRLAQWVLAVCVREAIAQIGIPIALDAQASWQDSPTRDVRPEDLREILAASTLDTYGNDAIALQRWIFIHWFELTGVPDCPVEVTLYASEDISKLEAAYARAKKGESLFKAPSAPDRPAKRRTRPVGKTKKKVKP